MTQGREGNAARWIDLEGVVNMRDVGGLPTRDGGRTAYGRLIRSDNLQDLTDASVTRLVGDLGVTDIVDLRSETEMHLTGPGPLREIESLTHHHHSLVETRPIDDVAATMASALVVHAAAPGTRDADYWTAHYRTYLDRRGPAIADALAVIAGARGAAVVHCAAGKDRTGTVVALALDVAGVPHDVIADDYALTALRLPAIIERLMAHDFYGDTLATQRPSDQIPHAETMLAILADLGERHGGTRAWLRSRGWSGGDVEQLRARLVD